MKIKLILMIYLLTLFSVNAQIKKADVKIIAKNPNPYYIDKNISGGFVEMLRDFVNGPLGIWAQDLHDRGFDYTENWSTSHYWNKFQKSDFDNGKWQMGEGGYNKNGSIYQRITNTNENGSVGISQMVYITNNVSSSFYVWAKSTSNAEVKIKLIHPFSDSIIFQQNMGKSELLWKKFTANIPSFIDLHKYILVIYFDGKGDLDLDEASLMPDNNVDGIRNEYFELFKLWQPGVIRYPGGGFADLINNNWYEGIGDIDQRKSPLVRGIGFNVQRLDWGTDEFIKFCRNLNIEPHIVVNLAANKPQDAADWVEYCNGDTSTYFGKLRAKNGNPEPYNVKLWEIGNEHYGDEIEMSSNYIKYYDSMIKADSTIKTIIDGNVWVKQENFDLLINAVQEKCDVYGWHWAQGGVPKRSLHNDSIYFNMVAGSEKIKEDIELIDKKIAVNSFNKNLKQGITEWWLSYIDNYDWLDTTAREQSLESGLCNAVYLQTFTQYPKYFNLAERTVGLCLIRNDTIPITGEKKIYGTPSFYSQVMMSRHSGNIYLNSEAICDKYQLIPVDGLLWITKEVPFLNVAVTKSNDSVFISVLNRSINDTMQTNFSFDYNFTKKDCKIYELKSDSYLDMNTPQEPEKIKIIESNSKFDGTYKFPPHSFTIIAYPEPIINSVDELEKCIILPNPAREYITIALDRLSPPTSWTQSEEIEIYDVMGNLQYSTPVETLNARSLQKIDVSFLPTGVYFVKIGNFIEKFVKY